MGYKLMKERLDYIDTAKGIGIIFVVFGHHLLEAESFRHWISCFHMPLFFIISGYLFAFRNNNSQSFGNYLINPDLHTAPNNQVFKPNCSRYLSDLGFLKTNSMIFSTFSRWSDGGLITKE